MEVHNNVAITNYQSSTDPWDELQALYAQAYALMQDMANHPQNTMQDLDQLTAIAQQMESISSGMKAPVSAPGFHADFANFLTYLNEMKSSILGDVLQPKQTQKDEHAASVELGNIFAAILQGLSIK